jgi:hypothetical protein
VEGVTDDVHEVLRGRDVVSETTDGGGSATHVILLPLSKEVHEEVSSEFLGKDLGEEVQVGDEGGLQNDGDIGGVEQLNGVRLLVSLHASAAHSDLYAEAL